MGKPADVYLIDEPSSYLDSEQRTMVSRVIRRLVFWPSSSICSSSYFYFCRFTLHARKTAFVVEHDMSMVENLADRVIVFEGVPSKKALANT